jgi:hypothetical protein
MNRDSSIKQSIKKNKKDQQNEFETPRIKKSSSVAIH